MAVLEDHPRLFAFRAGQVRFSVFGGGRKLAEGSEDCGNTSVVLCTDDLDSMVAELREKGVRFDGEVQDAPGFMRYITFSDPDNNQIYLAQYAADPLATG